MTCSVTLGKPVIHVVLNYRLTIFGFVRLPILKDQKFLNVGMRDQRAGFQWVKDNIAEFGGDPDKITAFGLGSGGTFSSLHLMTYGGERGVPFTRAWAMSGPPGTALNMTSDATELHTYAVAEKLGCKDDDDEDAFPGVYHYVLNQSMVTPLFHGAGTPYLGAVHGSDLDYTYNNMFPREAFSEADLWLSDFFISLFVNFAYTG